MNDTRGEGRTPLCELCGHPMPKGEEMFKYHGHSGPCPSLSVNIRSLVAAIEERYRAPTSDTEDVGEEDVAVVAKALSELHGDQMLGGDMSVEDEARFILARLHRTPETESLKKAFVAGTKIGPCPGTEDLEFNAWLATQDPNAGGEE